MASHDLQELLRKVQQLGDLLNDQYADQLGPGVDYLHRMPSAASRMSTLINDLLSFSRIVTQPETARPVDLNQVLDGVLSDLELRIAETGARIERDALPIVNGDSSQLGQLFFNLLANALKFHRRGENGSVIPPRISVRTQPVAAVSLPASVKPTRVREWYYQIEVADNGIGFDEQYVDRIFQIFQRLHGRSEFRGTGIGLAICEKVVANHGGAIRARSQVGLGATFSIYLPVE